MKRLAWLLLSMFALTSVASPAFAQREILCGFTGFDYAVPQVPGSGIPVPFLSNGDSYFAVGAVTSFSPLLSGVVIPGTEHTFYLFDAVAANTSFSGNVLEVLFQPHARIRLYEDFANNLDYGTSPPNATSPSTFTDGTLIVGADVNQLELVYDYNSNVGIFDGTATLDEGSDLFAIPAGQRGGWLMSGQAGPPNSSVPSGYLNQLNGQIQVPSVTPVAHKTWGSIKALYR